MHALRPTILALFLSAIPLFSAPIKPLTGKLVLGPSAPAALAPAAVPPLENVIIGGGGYLTGIYFNAKTPGLAYLTCDMIGPWKRETDAGPWSLLPVHSTFSPQPNMGVTSVAIHPANPDIVYADIGWGDAYGLPHGLYKSIDGGKTWRRVLDKYTASNQDGDKPATGARQWGPSLAIDPLAPDIVYWGTRREGLWRSTDAGETWTHALPLAVAARNVAIDPSQTIEGRAKNIYIGVFSKGIYASHDGGLTFAPDPGFAALASDRPQIRWLRVADDGTVIAAHDNHISRLDTKGWSDISPVNIGEVQFAGVAVDRRDSSRILAVASGFPSRLFRSTDGGKTWSEPAEILSGEKPAWQIHFRPMMAPSTIELDPARSGTAYVVDAFSCWRSDDVWADTVTFRNQIEGNEATVTLTLSAPPAGPKPGIAPLFTGISDLRGFRHPDIFTAPADRYIMIDDDWSTYVNGIDFCEADPNVVYAAKSWEHKRHKNEPLKDDLLLRSTDNGRSWLATTSPIPGEQKAGSKVAVSATEPGRVVYFPGNGQSPRVTADGGVTWKIATVAGTGKPLPFLYDKNSAYNFALAQAADRVDGLAFYAYIYRKDQPGQFWTSRDGGETWSLSPFDLPAAGVHDSLSPVTISATPGHAGDAWIALAGGGLWHTTDYGKTFVRSDAFPGSRPLLVSVGAADPREPQSAPAIYVYGKGADGLDCGLHQSLDGGLTWRTTRRIGQAKTLAMILMADRQTFGRVYLGTPGLGVWYVQTDSLLTATPAETPSASYSN